MYRKRDHSIIKHLDFLLLDLLAMEVAFALAYLLRHGDLDLVDDQPYLMMTGILAVIHVMVAIFGENYKDILRRGYFREFVKVFWQCSMVELLAVALMFFMKAQASYSRMVFLQLWMFSVLFIYLERIGWKKVQQYRVKNSEERDYMLVLSDEAHVKKTIEKLTEKKYRPFRVVGISVFEKNWKGRIIKSVPVVANWEDVFEYALTEVVDEVFLDIHMPEKERNKMVEKFLEMGITVHVNLDWMENELPNKTVQNLGGYSVLTTCIKTAKPHQLLIKRLMDIAGGLAGIVLTAILYVFLAPVIYIQSPGPVFFSQERVGRNGRRFRIYKFRSMYMDAEERKKELMAQNKMDGLMFKMDNDPRIFPAGKIIRKLSLDEFPQFWNVLRGDMSLVGTRPPTVDEVEQYEAHHKVRLSIKPGLTGMWQVSGRSNITDFEEVVRLDNQYISEWSIGLDIKILWKTVLVVLGREGSV